MSKKCRAYSESKLGLEPPDNRKAFYAGWDAARRAALEQEQAEPVPAGYLVSPHGEFKPNFNLRFTFPPESLDWSIPLYTAPPQRKPLTEGEQDWSLLSVTQESLREHMAELKKVSEERDELLNVLETLVEHFEYYMGDNECRPLENARAAIARATEGGNNE